MGPLISSRKKNLIIVGLLEGYYMKAKFQIFFG